jgi:hypothetical protein
MDRIRAGGRAGDAVEALPQMRNAQAATRGVSDEAALLRDLCETMKYGSLCALGGFTPYPVLSAGSASGRRRTSAASASCRSRRRSPSNSTASATR